MNVSDIKPRVLIVDDDPIARETLADRLSTENFACLFAADGFAALKQLELVIPDLILLDVMLPQMDGLEVCHRIKGNEKWRHVPIILITALDSKEDMIAGLDAGADEFLSKPVDGAELRARVRSMLRIKQQYDGLQETLQLREDLVNMLVHDLRSPLAIMMLQNSLMLQKPETISPKWLKAAQIIHGQLHGLDSFINDMLIVAKMENGRLFLNYSDVDVNDLVVKAKDNYKARAKMLDIEIDVHLAPENPSLRLDVNLFRRVLDNLISNALKFSPQGSRITLQASCKAPNKVSENPVVCIQVLDEGPGIPADHRDSIFNKFEIVGLRKKGISQIGLGLAFCKMVMDAHGGTISVGDNKPRGAVFTIEIGDSALQ
jgi:signal transduction histidine kinase